MQLAATFLDALGAFKMVGRGEIDLPSIFNFIFKKLREKSYVEEEFCSGGIFLGG